MLERFIISVFLVISLYVPIWAQRELLEPRFNSAPTSSLKYTLVGLYIIGVVLYFLLVWWIIYLPAYIRNKKESRLKKETDRDLIQQIALQHNNQEGRAARFSETAIRPNFQFLFQSVNFIPLSIFIAKLLDAQGTFRLYDPDSLFVSNFINWFGILYGILLPLILIRVWEQLDILDTEFDREADTIKLLYEDIFYLAKNRAKIAKETGSLLQRYVNHILVNYQYELKTFNDSKQPTNSENQKAKTLDQLTLAYISRFLHLDYKQIDHEEIKLAGDNILFSIRQKYKILILSGKDSGKMYDPVVDEIYRRLNDIVNIRATRIGLASQRLFQSLRIVALITSITFLLPFYFVGFEKNSLPLDNFLVGSVTLLVIFIYLIIEDFDEPFGGTWRITPDSWDRVLEYMTEHQPELDKLDKQNAELIPTPISPSSLQKSSKRKK